MDATTYSILAIAAGFALGVAWHWAFRRERDWYRVPARERIVTVAAVRCPQPGTPCHDLHHHMSAGERCYVCGERITRAAG